MGKFAPLFVSFVLVTTSAVVSSAILSGNPDATNNEQRAVGGYQQFKSSNATPPVLQISKSGEPLAPGLLAFVPEAVHQAPLLMTDEGDLVWSGPIENAAHLQVEHLANGKKVLARWSSSTIRGLPYGQITMLDDTYSPYDVICPQVGLNIPLSLSPNLNERPQCEADYHEAYFTDRNSVIVTAINITEADLSQVGGPEDGWIRDGQFYEIDLDTKNVMFNWSSIAHVPVTKSINTLMGTVGTNESRPYDYFHINSVQRLQNGSYLVNSRYTSAMYLLDTDGEIIWEFNGYDGGRFGPLPDNGNFAYQHDPRVADYTDDTMTIHLFDNDNSQVQQGAKTSYGLEFFLDAAQNTSTLLRRLGAPTHPVASQAQGNWDALPNGNVLIGYGSVPIFKEFGPGSDSDVRMAVRFGQNNVTRVYRVFRQVWHATPAAPPDVAVDTKQKKGYVSWNGATDVTKYIINAGPSEQKLAQVNQVPKKGFETAFPLKLKKGFVRVDAYQGDTLLGKSMVTQVG